MEKAAKANGEASRNPLGSLATLLSAPGDLTVVFAGMIPHAPESIQPDTVAVHDALSKLQDNLGSAATNPVGALGANLINSLASSGSFQRVGEYLQARCPLGSALARRFVQALSSKSTGPSNEAAPHTGAPVTVAPAVGTRLASVKGAGRLNVVTNGNGFDIVGSLLNASGQADESSVTSYDAAGNRLTQLRAGALTGECGAADVVVPGRGRLIVGFLVTNTPAEGIRPASASTQIKAWNAQTGAPVWSSKLFAGDPECKAYEGSLWNFDNTLDGRWGIALEGETGGQVIDLVSGAVRPDSRAVGMIGSYVADATNPTWGRDSPYYLLVAPGTGAVVGRIHNDGTAGGRVSGHRPGTVVFERTEGGAEMAPSWLFLTNSKGSSPRSGTTSTGAALIAIPNQESVPSQRIYAYTLPSMNVAWQTTEPYPPYIAGDGGGTLVVNGHICKQGESTCLLGYDDRTGKRLWQLPAAEVCDLTSSQMLAQVNGDFAVINLKTGKQMSYFNANGAECPTILPGGIGVEHGAGVNDPTQPQEITVTQELSP